MVRKSADVPVAENVNMRGGDGTVFIHNLLDGPPEMQERGRLFARIVVEPGCSIGFHRHEKEMEGYVCVKGEFEYDDNGTVYTLGAGDVTLTNPGEGHGVRNIGTETVELIAMILYEKE